MAKNREIINQQDELYSLAAQYGISIDELIELIRLGQVEVHAFTDNNDIVPQSRKWEFFGGKTLRRGFPHSHPNDDHMVHPLENIPGLYTGSDPIDRLRKIEKTIRETRKK